MAQRALCRLSVIRTMMQPRVQGSNAAASLQNNFRNQRLMLRPCSAYSSDAASPVIFSVQDADDFKDKVLNNKIPCVVDFHAEWCGPCKMLGPRLEKVIAETEGKVQLAQVDIDANTDLAIDYDVDSVPTVLAVKDGKIIDKFIGLKDSHLLKIFVEKLY